MFSHMKHFKLTVKTGLNNLNKFILDHKGYA